MWTIPKYRDVTRSLITTIPKHLDWDDTLVYNKAYIRNDTDDADVFGDDEDGVGDYEGKIP